MANALKPGQCLIEVIEGSQGMALTIGDDNGGYRLAGPKAWGGGRTIHRFVVNIDELLREAQAVKEAGHASDPI